MMRLIAVPQRDCHCDVLSYDPEGINSLDSMSIATYPFTLAESCTIFPVSAQIFSFAALAAARLLGGR